jgi:hypothetical protein
MSYYCQDKILPVSFNPTLAAKLVGVFHCYGIINKEAMNAHCFPKAGEGKEKTEMLCAIMPVCCSADLPAKTNPSSPSRREVDRPLKESPSLFYVKWLVIGIHVPNCLLCADYTRFPLRAILK